VSRLAPVALLLTGCVNLLGFPDRDLYPAASDDEGLYFPADTASEDCDFWEREPNGGEEDYDFNALTSFERGQIFTVCGHLSELDVDNQGSYTGDWDIYLFDLREDRDLRLALSGWSSADLDMHLCDSGGDCRSATGTSTPAVISDDLDADYYLLYIIGVDGPPTDYRCVIEID
jgi:hypothetical protein